MMNSRRICPADGSQYKDSAVGLVFMESAAGLAMETSKVESVVPDGLSPAVAIYQQITPIRSTTGCDNPSSACTRSPDEICTDGFSSSSWPERFSGEEGGGGGL
ncbi:dirigent protein 9-like [Dorcoceras hygrometricum]|uniref:Dirigent protein 9-like n=1 Tax=Dorcoceras hygrometricum TaxID=472368 RepID=A0A2Z7A5X4_9LAMI|nr:dirigent protein 9-like [Dorcoceras hygrometricum]